MHAWLGVPNPGCISSPKRNHAVGNPLHRPHILVARGEVERRGESCLADKQPLSQQNVAVQRLEHMLPRAQRIRTTDAHRLAGLESTDQVGDETVLGPVAAADHVARARSGHSDTMLLQTVNWKKRTAEGRTDYFCTGFAR